MTYAPRHLQAEPNVASKVASAVVGRRGKALTGAAIAIPTTFAAIGAAAPAQAATAPAAVHAAAPAAAAPAVIKTATTVVYVRYGSRSNYVKVVQQRLHISADGIFGPVTLSHVKSFQRSHRLAVDGIVGPATWRALGGFPGSTAGSSTPVSRSARSSQGAAAVAIAKRYLGTPYVYGGSTPRGFDCSGFTSYVYKQLGVSLPRSANAQKSQVRHVSSPQVGDLVFFGSPAWHVGIYVGNGQMIAAPKPGDHVKIQAIFSGFSGYGRV